MISPPTPQGQLAQARFWEYADDGAEPLFHEKIMSFWLPEGQDAWTLFDEIMNHKGLHYDENLEAYRKYLVS